MAHYSEMDQFWLAIGRTSRIALPAPDQGDGTGTPLAAIEPVPDKPTPEAAHSWVLASFQNGVRLGHDPRPPEETGLWTWTCSACGFTDQAIGSVVPPANSPACVSRSARPGKISERFRSFLSGREVSDQNKCRFENLLCWMDRYQEEDFPIPPHWVSEALAIMTEGRAK